MHKNAVRVRLIDTGACSHSRAHAHGLTNKHVPMLCWLQDLRMDGKSGDGHPCIYERLYPIGRYPLPHSCEHQGFDRCQHPTSTKMTVVDILYIRKGTELYTSLGSFDSLQSLMYVFVFIRVVSILPFCQISPVVQAINLRGS